MTNGFQNECQFNSLFMILMIVYSLEGQDLV